MKEYFKEIIKGDKPSLIVFFRAAEPDAENVRIISEELKTAYGDRISVQTVDVSDNHKVADQYRVTVYPTWVIFKEGEELMRESGVKPVTAISEMIDRAF